MKLGDQVTWTSKAQGCSKTKQGYIVQVVSPGSLPNRERFPSLYKSSGVGMNRDHESYVVAVSSGKNGNGRMIFYWPRVAQLIPKGAVLDA